MTCIAYDGKTLAADKQCTNNGYPYVVTKIFKVPQGMIGFTGNAGHSGAILNWFNNGMVHKDWPYKAGGDTAGVLFIASNGEVRGYSGDDGPHYTVYQDEFVAFGSGRDYALAAMHMGRGAEEAVALACKLDTSCGNGIDTLTL